MLFSTYILLTWDPQYNIYSKQADILSYGQIFLTLYRNPWSTTVFTRTHSKIYFKQFFSQYASSHASLLRPIVVLLTYLFVSVLSGPLLSGNATTNAFTVSSPLHFWLIFSRQIPPCQIIFLSCCNTVVCILQSIWKLQISKVNIH